MLFLISLLNSATFDLRALDDKAEQYYNTLLGRSNFKNIKTSTAVSFPVKFIRGTYSNKIYLNKITRLVNLS